ncbi:MAG TPA: ABC-2 transporter permease [Verrucomicrobiae bacterium]|nr:ABC-2 transporter permease [Verrucomicrobiae bacterium]
MNYSMVKCLMLKDWYLQRWTIAASLAAGAVTLAIILSGNKAAFYIGLLLLITVVISVGAHLAISTMVLERKEQTLSFVMSLPISYREYTAAKILVNLVLFLIPWLALVLGSFAIILLAPGLPHGLLPYVAIMATEILVSTSFIVSVALISESQGWTVAAIIAGNLALNVVGYFVAHIGSIARTMGEATVQWSPAGIFVLVAEFAAIALLLGFTFFLQSRKKDFL